MRRFALAVLVACLTLSASGAYALLIAEPCSSTEQSEREDGSCPPTCVTCGCCAQAVEPVAVVAAASPDAVVTDTGAVLPGLPDTDPRPILHVPKLHPA